MQCRMLVVIVLCCAAARSGSVRFPDEPQYHSLPHDQRKQPDFHFPSVRFPSDSNPDLDPGKAPSNLAGLGECGISTFHHNRRKPRVKINSTETMTGLLSAMSQKYRNVQLKGRIINGKESNPGAWPWQVSLQLLHPKKGFMGHLCGGMFISGQWILTAAHCISNEAYHYPYGPFWTVVAGEHDRTFEEGTEQRLMVEKVIIHERFRQYHHDIALLKLMEPVDLNLSNYISSICLPPEDDIHVFKGVNCIATGWGQSKFGGKLDQKLHQTDLSVVDNQQCQKVYNKVYKIAINSYHICAGAVKEASNKTGTCVGDSGGPLQCSLRDGRWYLAGITSFGSGCAKSGFPDVFTRLSYYIPWINGKLRSN